MKKLLFLGSSCIYPKFATQPITEDQLMSGPLEPTNDAYAIAKIAGIKMCDAYRSQYGCHFISAMPTNLYGPNDNYDLKTSHVLPALIRKFHQAKVEQEPTVVLWGTGRPLREFMHVDDLADAVRGHPDLPRQLGGADAEFFQFVGENFTGVDRCAGHGQVPFSGSPRLRRSRGRSAPRAIRNRSATAY